MPRLRVIRPGLQTSLQDPGRRGYEHLGVMVGGWLDDFAARWANRLLHNPDDAALLEITLLGPELVAEDDGWVALTGADLEASVNGDPWPPGSTWHLHTGDHIRFGSVRRGARAYLAGLGGILGTQIMGSRTTDLVARFGGLKGRALQVDDIIEYGEGDAQLVMAPYDTCLHGSEIRVLPGVRRHRFPEDSWTRLLKGAYRVNARSDRIGIRLDGDPVTDYAVVSDDISEGMAIGSIEVPPSGELLVLLKSRGSIGGYPTLAHVITADWPVLAQLRPSDPVTFRSVDELEAREALQERERLLAATPLPTQHSTVSTDKISPQTATVQAPMWGAAYVSTTPGGPPLVNPGDHVKPGQVLAILEVMKQFYDLTSPISGKIVSVAFTDGSMVEKGTPLIEIEADN